MPEYLTTTFNPTREESVIQFRDYLFKIKDIDTAMVLFVSGASNFLKVNFMALVIHSGRNDFFHVIERSIHSKKGVIKMKRHPFRIVEMITRRWKTEFLVKNPIGNHHTTIWYLIAGDLNNKQMTVEDVLIWENLVAIASVAFVNLVNPDTKNNYHEKNAKRKKKKDPVREKNY